MSYEPKDDDNLQYREETISCLSDRLKVRKLQSEKLTSSDSKAGVEVVDDGEQSRLPLEGHPVGRDEAKNGNEDDEGGVEPVHMLMPVGPGHWRVGDVNLLLVDTGPGLAERLVLCGAIREG